MRIEWKESGRYVQVAVGHLFAYIDVDAEDYKTPGHPDYEPATFEWFIAPDDEDKNYRRALASGREATLDDAKHRIKAALHEILAKLGVDIGRLA